MRRAILIGALCSFPLLAAAQEPWSLDQCIGYAQKNNIEVRQQAIRTEDSEVKLSTARNSRLPDLNASMGANIYFGRGPSRDGTYIDNTQLSGSLGATTSVPIFQGMRINREIKGAKLDLQAAAQDHLRAKEDVGIRVMTLYLEVLFNKEVVAMAERQLALSTQQTERSRQLVDEGRKATSALYESDALQANDLLALTEARNNLQLALLDLSQALNRPSVEGFDILTPTFDSLGIEQLRELGSPEEVYAYADMHRPVILAERLRLQGSENAVKTARSYRYPSVSLSAGYGTNVYRSYASGVVNTDFWSQLRNNGNEYIGISVNVPIFNRLATRNNIRSTQLAMQSQELTLTQTQQNLRKEIEQAYYKADAAYAKYHAADKAFASARIAFRFEEQKTNAGRSTIFDYNDARTRMLKAESDLIQAKYEFIFRRKILDFYKGDALQL